MHQTPNAIAMKAQHHAWVRNKYKSSGYKNWIGKASSVTPQQNHAVHIPVSPKFFFVAKKETSTPQAKTNSTSVMILSTGNAIPSVRPSQK